MLEVVEKFHNLGFLHRDIKPSNFRVMEGKVYLTEFGTVTPYKDANGVHIKEQYEGFFGTIKYSSMRT